MKRQREVQHEIYNIGKKKRHVGHYEPTVKPTIVTPKEQPQKDTIRILEQIIKSQNDKIIDLNDKIEKMTQFAEQVIEKIKTQDKEMEDIKKTLMILTSNHDLGRSNMYINTSVMGGRA
jgi:hypothetical protein